MPQKSCASCGNPFLPRAQVPNQTFCSKPECQRARRQCWQQEKLQNDPDYRDNQSRVQRAWAERNPDYWRNYRARNPEYTEKNRQNQRGIPGAARETTLAKMDASILTLMLQAGVYRITPVHPAGPGKRKGWTVEIKPLCSTCPCQKDACKERT